MDLGIVSVRYARALLLFAVENGEEEAVYRETLQLARTFLSVPALSQALLNPSLTDERKQQLLLTAACGSAKPTRSLERFVALLMKKGRAEAAQLVAHSYGTLYRREKHIVQASLTLPAKVDAAVTQRLKKMVESRTQSTVVFEVEEKPEILGGFVLEYDTYQLDASVRGELGRIRRTLV